MERIAHSNLADKMGDHEWTPFTDEEEAEFKKIYTKAKQSFIHVGPKGYVLPRHFLTHAEDCVWNMPLRATDVFVATFPRSGTTWTQELVWLLCNNLDFEKAKAIPLVERFPFLELYMLISPEMQKQVMKNGDEKTLKKRSIPAAEHLARVPETEQRFIKTHLPMSLLPRGALNTKVVYVARDPRDVAVSCYHFFKAQAHSGIECDFKTYYYETFAKNYVIWSPYFDHIKEAWALRHHPNLLFIFYEELSLGMKATARKVATFLGKEYTDEDLERLSEHLHFDNFQKNSAVDLENMKRIGMLQQNIAGKNSFIRKGKAGTWTEHFDEEMTAHAQRWIEENLRGTDIQFPQS